MMGQVNAKRAFIADFAALGYSYVSYPNGPKINTPSAPIPVNTLWYALHVLSSKPTVRGSGDPTIRYKGLFQITIRAPVSDSYGNPFGTYAIDAAAELLAARYKIGTSLPYPIAAPTVYCHCNEPEIVELGNVEPEWYAVVVRVPFWMDN